MEFLSTLVYFRSSKKDRMTRLQKRQPNWPLCDQTSQAAAVLSLVI
jgi:hypothetical protein